MLSTKIVIIIEWGKECHFVAKSFLEVLLPFLIRDRKIKRLVGFRDSPPSKGCPKDWGGSLYLEND
jgi:hypothetical protein